MKVRPISYDDRLSIVDHLDELRSRIFVCLTVLIVAFGICFWQNGHLINVLNSALPPSAKTGLADQSHEDSSVRKGFVEIKHAAGDLSKYADGLSGPGRKELQTVASKLEAGSKTAIKALPKNAQNQAKPITIGVGESFTTTLMVVGYFALLISLPVFLYQLYAFVIPALSRNERRIAVPTMVAAPLLFLAGAVFSYFAILPPAIHFLQGYNSAKFQVLVQARSYYKFEILLMLGIGLAFEVPLFLLALQKVGVITARTLTLNWRYATVLIAVITAALPGVDPVTMVLEMTPLILLYLASIVLLNVTERRAAKRAAAASSSGIGEAL